MTARAVLRVGAVTSSLVVGVAVMTISGAPATAAPATTAPAVSASCARSQPQQAPLRRIGVRHDDMNMSARQVKRLDNNLHQRLNQVRRKAGRAPMSRARVATHRAVQLKRIVRIPVYVHIIRGRHKHDRRLTRPQARRVVRILRAGFRGGQSRYNHMTRYYFYLKKFSVTRNDKWFHAKEGSRADKAMKRHLHRGGRRALNLYFTNGGGTYVLGYSRFPWQYHRAPRLDGVTVSVNAMPGGRLKQYNRGDTVIHETGHWLGLLHTFQNGCQYPGDAVADTPYERFPSVGCTSFLCSPLKQGQFNPVHNFMDYGTDRCMYMFTADQALRMDNEFIAYRM